MDNFENTVEQEMEPPRDRYLSMNMPELFEDEDAGEEANEEEEEGAKLDAEPFPHFSTLAIHSGQEPERWKALNAVPSICVSTTFKQEDPGKPVYEYTRVGNPTRDALEACLAALEGAKFALAFSSGMSTVMTIGHLLEKGDHVLIIDDVYGGTNAYFSKLVQNHGLEVTFCDFTNLEVVRGNLRPTTKLVWFETPTNPTLKVTDIEEVAKIVHSNSEAFIVVDNTFATPYFQRPLKHGADIVMHSCTKYINGHTDVLMGCLMMNDEDKYEKIKFLQLILGAVPSPFDCYMVNRGIKTLRFRMEQHMKNSFALAKFLEENPRVEKVIHPLLPSHPNHATVSKQMMGFSGMLSFYIKGGLNETKKFMRSLKLFMCCSSLGGYESICEIPVLMTHALVSEEHRLRLGIRDNLIRVSCGIETTDDLIKDIDQALKAAVPMGEGAPTDKEEVAAAYRFKVSEE